MIFDILGGLEREACELILEAVCAAQAAQDGKPSEVLRKWDPERRQETQPFQVKGLILAQNERWRRG